MQNWLVHQSREGYNTGAWFNGKPGPDSPDCLGSLHLHHGGTAAGPRVATDKEAGIVPGNEHDER